MKTYRRETPCGTPDCRKTPRTVKAQLKKITFLRLKVFLSFLIDIRLKLFVIHRFDFLREPRSAVPLYADERGSLVFVAFSTVHSVSKKYFPDTLTYRRETSLRYAF